MMQGHNTVRLSRFVVALAGLAAAALPAAADPPLAISMGIAPVVPDASTFLAIDEGYVAKAGFSIKLERSDSAATLIPFLASDRFQVVQGGISLGYFNAVAQGLPVTLALDSGSTPINNNLMLRPDLVGVIKTPRDLKGRRIAVVAPGSIPLYEVGKVLEKAGLTLKDVDIAYMPFQNMGAAFANHAIDAALEVSPYVGKLAAEGLAKRWLDPDTVIEPRPTTVVAYMVNTDWAAKNKAAAHRLFTAFARAGREYCDAYHHGSNRGQVVDELVKHGVMADAKLLDGMSWQARDPDGRFNLASLEDVQQFFHREGMLKKMAPAARLVDTSYAADAANVLGPYKPANPSSPLQGCR